MKRSRFLSFVAATLFAAALPLTAIHAQERGSKDEAKALVEAAIAHVKKVGVEQAFKEFQTDKAWIKKDLYVFAYDFAGNCKVLAVNDKMVGKNLLEMKDPNGFPIIKEFIGAAQKKGSAWVDYEFADPVSKKMKPKSSFVQRVPGAELLLGVGVYL